MSREKQREARRADNARTVAYLKERAAELRDSNQNARNAQTVTAAARDQLFVEQLEAAITKVFKNKIQPVKHQPKKGQKTERIINAMFSDTHYGAGLDPKEVGHSYGPTECSRRTAHVIKNIADYKRDHRKDSKLYIHLLGDIIQGQLHDPRDGEPLAMQFAIALDVLSQGIRYLAEDYSEVVVFCTPGNHGRNKARHPDRAVNQKWDSIETMLYLALRQAFQAVKNVRFEIPKTPYYTYQAFGETGFMTHGDTVIKPGYPNKLINVEHVNSQVDKLNAGTFKKVGKGIGLIGVGHVHTGSLVYLPGGTNFMTNGPLIPSDAYAQSIGLFETACGQWLWESVPGHIVGDHRYVKVNKETDADSSLDKIIKPFKDW